jgi:hypothetical protein
VLVDAKAQLLALEAAKALCESREPPSSSRANVSYPAAEPVTGEHAGTSREEREAGVAEAFEMEDSPNAAYGHEEDGEDSSRGVGLLLLRKSASNRSEKSERRRKQEPCACESSCA